MCRFVHLKEEMGFFVLGLVEGSYQVFLILALSTLSALRLNSERLLLLECFPEDEEVEEVWGRVPWESPENSMGEGGR